MKNLTIGILAHVDAGKTTLSEALLYNAGAIRTAGRVDHGDAFLDTESVEKERGITVYSKEARFTLGDDRFTLLDTPGHVDFSAETERVLSVLDAAVLLISAPAGIQPHTETLWKLLERYQVPVFLFVNKTDLPYKGSEALLQEIRKKLSGNYVDFTGYPELSPENAEQAALSDEEIMNDYLETGQFPAGSLSKVIRERKLFPVFFGSALKNDAVSQFLNALSVLLEEPAYTEEFGARFFKISRGRDGRRMVDLKVTGGILKNRTELVPGEKITEIRQYNGSRYRTLDEAGAGEIVSVLGVNSLDAGAGLGFEEDAGDASLLPVLDYTLSSPDADPVLLYRTLSPLSEEFPELGLQFSSESSEIHVRLMGEVQTEILERIVMDRYHLHLRFGEGRILYRETIAAPVEGVGHFEPLRHYAEVHVLLTPLPRGSGIVVDSVCPKDELGSNWQKTVLSVLRKTRIPGVLTGSNITDIRITLIAGRASEKHTGAGDFREAALRAVRQGLRKADNVLLEPYYRFTLEVPADFVGHAMTDLSNMHGTFSEPETEGEMTALKGRAPVRVLRNYAKDLAVYSRGRGRLYVEPDGYDECGEAEPVIFESGYDPDSDLLFPCSSVFCAHGTGFLVPFDQVEKYAHVPSPLETDRTKPEEADTMTRDRASKEEKSSYRKAGRYLADAELEDIFVRTYGEIRNRAKEVNLAGERTIRAKEKEENVRAAREARLKESFSRQQEPVKEYLLVDGYNIIFSWPELKDLSTVSLDGSRARLLEILSDDQGLTGQTVIVVFDAYRVARHPVEERKIGNIYEVFTREAETADEYIEKLSGRLSDKHLVTVATSDKVLQVITWSGNEVRILSAKQLLDEVTRRREALQREQIEPKSYPKPRLASGLPIPEQQDEGE